MVLQSWSWNSSSASATDSGTGSDPAALGRSGHTAIAVILGAILAAGFLSNLLVLLLFARFRSLRTPVNVMLANISASDLLVCACGTPLSLAASVRGRWLAGARGCRWYGFANTCFGIVSLVSLSILSYERCSAVLRCTQADVSDFRKAWLCVAGSWFYALLWSLPPFLGWSSYGPEGAGTTCSVQWHQRTASSVSYVVCLFIFCLLLPLVLMVLCYSRILCAVRRVARINLMLAQRRENHVLVMVVCMVTCYLLCWLPYGVVALVATFGKVGAVSPLVSTVPSVLAKSSTVFNPIIYVLLNSQFYRCFMAFMTCRMEPLQLNPTGNMQLSSRAEDHRSANSAVLPPPQGARAPAGLLTVVVHYKP